MSVVELLAPTLNRSSVLDEFKPYLTRRWNEGCTDGAKLHAELKAGPAACGRSKAICVRCADTA